MEAKTVDTQHFTLTRRIAAEPARVFDAWTTEEIVKKWFAPNDEMTVEVTDFDPTPGGRYRIQMKHQFGNVHTVGGTFHEVDRPRRIVMTWKWEGEAMAALPDTKITVDFVEIEGGTELSLLHEGFPNQEAADNHGHGWNGCTWRLERVFAPSSLHHDSIALALNRKLFTNALDGVAPADLRRRTSPTSNSMLWIAGHVAHTRAMIAKFLGQKVESPLEVFNKEISDSVDYPEIEQVTDFFNKVTHSVFGGLSTATDDHLAGPAPFQLPIADQTMGGAIAFLVQHEAYHVGQMGILRKELGYNATSYA